MNKEDGERKWGQIFLLSEEDVVDFDNDTELQH